MVGMNPTHPNLHSTRLENLGLESYGVSFDIDGQTVQIRGDSRTPLVGAMQAFHRQALDDFLAYESRPRPGWFARLKSWVGRVFRPAPSAQGPEPRTLPQPAPVPYVASPAPPIAERAPAAPPAGATARPVRPNEPVLRSVFADKDGVHLIWQPAPAKGVAKPVAMTYNLDSKLAGRLQECYGHLAELGYKVAGLELLRPSPEQAGKAPEKAEPGIAAAVPEAGRERVAEGAARPRAPRARPAPPKAAEPAPALPAMKAHETPAAKKELLPEPG